jgi:hypothetical protein
VDLFHVEKHGAGQYVFVGTPNCGKSALVGALTKAHVNVAPYPFATHAPVPGMMPFEDIQIQLVDMPPVTAEGMPPGMRGTIRNADGLLVCADLSAPDVLEPVDTCLGLLKQRGLAPWTQQAADAAAQAAAAESERPPSEAEQALQPKTMILVGTKLDLPGAAENFEALKELYGGQMPMLATSAKTLLNLGELARLCFKRLGIVRVYSKEPGKHPDMEKPFILPQGSTVLDMAAAVHRDLAANLKRARIWGANMYDGQPVQRDHVLADRDIIELHV